MPSFGTRHRSLIDPIPFSGSKQILLGYYQSRAANGTWSAPVGHVFATYGSLGYPGIRCKSMWDQTHKGPPYDSGGPMRSIEIECASPFGFPIGRGTYYNRAGNVRYVGGFQMPSIGNFGANAASTFFTNNIGSGLAYLNPYFSSNLLSWSNKAWSSTAPRLEKAGGAVFIAELSDIPRMLKGTSKFFHDIWKSLGGNLRTQSMTPKGAADHFLNHQFGWRPFTSDLSKFYQTYRNTADIIQRLTDENGQWIRNRATLKGGDPVVTDMGTGTGFFLFPNTSFFDNSQVFDRGWMSGNPTYHVWEEESSSVVAVGKFRYYRPEFDRNDPGYLSRMYALQRRLDLYGLRINPSNVYKATPWTWAADWISDAGRYIDRVNDYLVDSVACKYLYITERKTKTRHYSVSVPFGNVTLNAEWKMVLSTHDRAEGSSPYGFDLTLANLTPRQLAIAGALGLTRYF